MDMKILTPIALKGHPKYNEKWLQKQIQNRPEILGLDATECRDVERIQPSGGRLDLLLTDADGERRYEVEIQLGETDESHIIRTIEYWDIERKRYPQYDHVAVLVAEELTSRFLNVIQLFNGHIPLVVIKMTAVEVDGGVSVIFTRVFDELRQGREEDDEAYQPADRAYWEKRSNKKMLALTDELFSVVQQLDSVAQPNYNKHYIGIVREGLSKNYCWFKPQKGAVKMLSHPIPDELICQELEAAGLDVEKKPKWDELWVRFTTSPTADQISALKKLVAFAMKEKGV